MAIKKIKLRFSYSQTPKSTLFPIYCALFDIRPRPETKDRGRNTELIGSRDHSKRLM